MNCSVLPTSWGTCLSGVAGSIASNTFAAVARSFGEAATTAGNWLWSQIGSATAVSLGGPGFNLDLSIVASITGVVAVGLFVIQMIQSVLRRDGSGIGRGLRGLVIAFIGGGAAIASVNILLAATDQLSQGVVQVATGTNIQGLGRLLLSTDLSTMSSPGLQLFLAILCLIAIVMIYAALVIRKVLIVVTAVFAPLAFAGSLADVTVSWTRKWIETTLALIFSKLLVVVIFVVGYGMLLSGTGQNGTGITQELTQIVSGILILALAGLAPWMALRIVHFTGDHASHIHSLGSAAAGGAIAATSIAKKSASMAQKAAPMTGSASSVGTTSAPTSLPSKPSATVIRDSSTRQSNSITSIPVLANGSEGSMN